MPPRAPILARLVPLVSGRPATRHAIARAVADEDARSLARLLARLGLEATPPQIEQLLDDPGPFLPSVRGWT